MICKVRHTIEKYGMLKKGDSVTVALSGGADSMCLLNIMLFLKDEIGFRLYAAHINHGIRGEEADRDSEFVAEYCNKNNIILHSCKLDVPGISSKTGEGLEECGRRLRYEYLRKIAYGGLVATAHNLNDRTETFIFNFTRGAGLNGLCSIPPVRDDIIRPLIDCSREEIEEYCRNNTIPFVTDSTNRDVKYTRNRIRHNVIPQLKSINNSFEAAALRCFESINSDNEFLDSLAESVYVKSFTDERYNTVFIKNEPLPIKNRVISKIIKKRTGTIPDRDTIYKISELIETGGRTEIINDVAVSVQNGFLSFPEKIKSEKWIFECKSGENSLLGAKIDVISFNKKSTNNTYITQNDYIKYSIDNDKIIGKAFFRSRADGDSFRPYGRNCTKTLRKLFNEKHIPPEKRNNIIVCCDEKGIIFVEGFGIDERFAVTDSTANILSFIIRRG